LIEFISHYPNSVSVEEAVNSQFSFLITELLRGIGTASPSSTVGKLYAFYIVGVMCRLSVTVLTNSSSQSF